MSVEDKILPPERVVKTVLLPFPVCLFLVLAETAIPIYGLAILRRGFKILFQADWFPLKLFCKLIVDPVLSNKTA